MTLPTLIEETFLTDAEIEAASSGREVPTLNTVIAIIQGLILKNLAIFTPELTIILALTKRKTKDKRKEKNIINLELILLKNPLTSNSRESISLSLLNLEDL